MQQAQGMQSFLQSGGGNCHSGPILSDYQLHVIGMADNGKNTASNMRTNGTYAFRTPSLGNMHSSTLRTLANVLDFYDHHHGTLTCTQTLACSIRPSRPLTTNRCLLPCLAA